MHRKTALVGAMLMLVVVGAGACGAGEASPVAPPPVTAAPGTALHQAQVCAQNLGRIPTWACQDGVQVPILVEGKPVTTTPSKCDNPDLKGACVVGSYAGRLVGQNHDGSPNPNVSWAYFCRRDDNFAQMIGHDRITGATCFFELKDGALPLENGVPKGKVPGVDAPEYEATWKRPDAVAVQRCNTCHAPDPFIHTPYVDAARWPADPTQPVVPQVASTTSPYFVMGEAFASWTFDYVEFDDNKCTSCHRMPDFRRFTFGSGVDFNAHMPPLSPGSMKKDFDAVMACLNEGPDKAAGCRWAALNGATPTTDPTTKTIDARGSFRTTFGTLDVADPFIASSGTLSGTGADFRFSKVGAIAGAGASTGMVQLDVIGHQEVSGAPQGIDYIARFVVPVEAFAAGKILASTDPAWSGQLLVADGADRTRSAPLGVTGVGTLTLAKAGVLPGDAVEGEFVMTWQVDAKK